MSEVREIGDLEVSETGWIEQPCDWPAGKYHVREVLPAPKFPEAEFRIWFADQDFESSLYRDESIARWAWERRGKL